MIKYYIFEFIRFLVRVIPPRLGYAIAAFLAETTCLFSLRSKSNLRANIIHVFNYLGKDTQSRQAKKNIRTLIRKNFRNFSYYLVDFFRFSSLNHKQIEKLVEFSGVDNIESALRAGKGAIGVTAHLGNWELGGMVLSYLGFPVHAIALSHHNTRLNRLFVNQRALSGMNVIPVGKAALTSLLALRNNQLVLILGDRDVTERGIQVEFFGAPVHIPRGPAILAVRASAGIFFGYFVRQSTHKYRAIFRSPIPIDPNLDRDAREKNIILSLVKEMEECIAANLDQWYTYERIWS